MKVAVLIDQKNVGGVEKIAIEQVRALREKDVDAVLAVLHRNESLESNFSDLLKNLPVVYLDDALPQFLKFSWKIPGFHFFSLFHVAYPFFLPWVIKRRQFDYIIVHGTFTTFSAISLKWFKKIPFSAFIWDPIGYILDKVYADTFSKPIMFILKLMAAVLDWLIVTQANSIMVGGAAHDAFFKKIKPSVIIETIPPATHPPKKKPPKKKKRQLLLVTAWKPGKKAEYLVELLPKIPKIPVKMVGMWVDPSYKKKIETLFQKHSLLDQVEIIGGVTEDELNRYYRESLVLLQINDDRGFGMPALEAAARSTTFVIPKNQGVCELFTDTVDGYYVTEVNTAEIANILTDLFTDSQKAAAMGQHAAKTAQGYFWDVHADKLISSIESQI